jgi:hypothetical protein
MKTACLVLAILGALTAGAQSAGDKAQQKCVQQKMNNRNAGEKVVDKVIPQSGQNRENTYKRECGYERVSRETQGGNKGNSGGNGSSRARQE